MRYEVLRTSFWADEDIHALSPEAKLLYLYVMTNEHSHGLSGLMRWSRSHAGFEIGWHYAVLDVALKELTDAGKVVVEGGWLWVKNRVKWAVSSPKHVASVDHILCEIPPKLRDEFLRKHKAYLDLHRIRKVDRDKP